VPTQQETSLATESPISDAYLSVPYMAISEELDEENALIRKIRRAAKRRRRLIAWIVPLIWMGMTATILFLSRVDMRLSLTVFAVSSAIVALGLARAAYQWERLARQAADLGDVRAIGPLLTVLNDRDSSACDTIEEALIELLPRVQQFGQLSRTSRRELNRLLLEFEMPGWRGGHNAELARIALETVVRFRDCSALPAVRRLADGFTATRPSAVIRDLAIDILPILEERAVLLRPSRLEFHSERAYLRPINATTPVCSPDELVRPSQVIE
jgi:hypothetical protein